MRQIGVELFVLCGLDERTRCCRQNAWCRSRRAQRAPKFALRFARQPIDLGDE